MDGSASSASRSSAASSGLSWCAWPKQAVDYARDFNLVREIDDEIGYEHKLRPPTTQPAEGGATTQRTE